MELQASIDITMVQSSGLKLENNIKTVYYVLKYARTVYNDFVQRGSWDEYINATPENQDFYPPVLALVLSLLIINALIVMLLVITLSKIAQNQLIRNKLN